MGLESLWESTPEAMSRCHCCKRTFVLDRIAKHETICQKFSKIKRVVFDAAKHRLQGTVAGKFLLQETPHIVRNYSMVNFQFAPTQGKSATQLESWNPQTCKGSATLKKRSTLATNINKKTRAANATVGRKKNDWRRKHNEFIATIRAAKKLNAFLAKGGNLKDLPPLPPAANPDYVQCPHCLRRFNEATAERHIPKCATMLHNKPKPQPKTNSKFQQRLNLELKPQPKSLMKPKMNPDLQLKQLMETNLQEKSVLKTDFKRDMQLKPEPRKDWRQKRNEFITTIRAARNLKLFLAKGGNLKDLPPPPPAENPDYVQCPHCLRRFNEVAAERHIPKCATMLHNKPRPQSKLKSGSQQGQKPELQPQLQPKSLLNTDLKIDPELKPELKLQLQLKTTTISQLKPSMISVMKPPFKMQAELKPLELELKSQSKSSMKTKLEFKPQPKSVLKPPIISTLKPLLRTQPEPEMKPERELNPQLKLQVKLQLKPQLKPDPKLKNQTRSQLVVKSQQELKQEMKSEQEPELKPQLKPSTKTQLGVKPQAKSLINSMWYPPIKTTPKPELRLGLRSECKPELELKTQLVAKAPIKEVNDLMLPVLESQPRSLRKPPTNSLCYPPVNPRPVPDLKHLPNSQLKTPMKALLKSPANSKQGWLIEIH